MKTPTQLPATFPSQFQPAGLPRRLARTRRLAWLPGLLAGALACFQATTASAQSGTWTNNGSGNWTDTTRWLSAIVASGTNNTANFSTINITANRTVTVDSGRVISDILLGDSSGSQNWIFSGGPLILANDTGTKPQLRASGGALSNTFNVEIMGSHGLRKEQANLVFLARSNSYSGDTDINRGTLRLGNANAIPNGPGKGNVTMVLGGGTPVLDLGTVNPVINGLNSTSAVASVTAVGGAGTSTLTLGAGDANGNFGGVIANGASRTVALTKTGAGTQTLTNINTYSGATTINGGVLQLVGDGSISSSSSIIIGAGGTLDVSGVAVPPYAINGAQALAGTGGTGAILGSVNLDAGAPLNLTYAAGTPTLNVASNTLTLNDNPTTVLATGGPLADGSYKLISISGNGAVAGTTGALTVGGLGIIGGGTPALSISGNELYLNITGGATVLEWGSGDGTWAVGTTGWNSGGGTAFANGNATLLSDKFSTGNPTITLNTEVLPQGVFVSSTNHYTLSGAGNIGGTAELRKLGPGALTVDVANTHSGGTVLFEGTLNLKNASALGAAAGTFTINGGTVDNTSGGALTLNNHPQVWNGNLTFLGSSDLNLGTGPVTMTAGRTITVNGSAKLTVGGDIAGVGFGFVKAGTGTLQLDGNNTMTASSTINQGEVIVGNDGALGGPTGLSLVFATDYNYKALSLNGHSITIRSLLMGGLTDGHTNTIIRNNHASTPVTLTVNPNAAGAYAGTITDGGAAPLSVIKDGTQNWTFGSGGAGAGSYSGDTTITAGTLTAGANNILPSGPGKGNLFVNSGATFDILDRSAMSLNGLWGGGVVNRSNPGGAPVATLTLGNNDASATFSGRIRTTHASATLHVTKVGTGTQVLSGANDFLGTTTISGGILQLGEGGTGGSLTSASIVNNTTLVYNRDGSMTYSGVISGPGNVTNAGPGVVSLSGANTYTGTTAINAGTLRVNSPGSLAVESAVTVNSGGTLGGTGTINGPVTIAAGGTLAPGASVGTLTINNTVSLGGTTVMEVSRDNGFAEYDQLNVGGLTLNYGGALVITNIGITSLRSGDTFNLFAAGTINPGFAPVNLPPLLPGLSWVNDLNANGSISITGTIIPPQFSAPVLSGNTVTFNGTGGVAFGSYYVLTSTEVGDPVANWTPIATNVFDAGGNFSFQDTDPSAPQRFYMIAIP